MNMRVIGARLEGTSPSDARPHSVIEGATGTHRFL